jgi:hypothetical protein
MALNCRCLKPIIGLLCTLALVNPITYAGLCTNSNDAVVVEYSTKVEIENNRRTVTTSYLIQVNNKNGERYTGVSIPYSSINKINSINANIQDISGNVIKKLSKADITSRSNIADFSFYEDEYVKEFNLKHSEYPYRLRVNYQVHSREFIYLDYWIPVIDNEIPTLSASLEVVVPPGFRIRHKDQNIDGIAIDTVANMLIYTWKASYKNIIKQESFAPSLDNYLPSVAVVAENFHFDEDGSCRDWISFGNWCYKLSEDLDEIPIEEIAKTDALIKDVTDPADRIKRLYHYLQDETRYINISIETGGLKPYSASYVAIHKYGDCKALSNYFKSLLQHYGIESYYSLVNAGDHISDIDQGFVAPQFNHVIVCVPIEKDTLWLDCTSSLPYGYQGTFIQDRMAFLVSKNKSCFRKIPPLTTNDCIDSRMISIIINEDLENAKLHFQNTYHGDNFENLAHLNLGLNQSKKAQIIRNHFSGISSDLSEFQIMQSHRDTMQILLSADAHSGTISHLYGKDLLVKVIPFNLKKPESPDSRKLPLQIDFPVYYIDTLFYEIPVKFRNSKLPLPVIAENDFGFYHLNFYPSEKGIMVIKDFYLASGRYPLSDYGRYYDFMKLVLDHECISMILSEN